MAFPRLSISMALLLCAMMPGSLVGGFSLSANTPLQSSKLPIIARAEKRSTFQLAISAASQDEQETRQSSQGDVNNQENGKADDYDDSIRRGLKRLAQLSLEDYAWRMSVFKEKEADRKVEEYMAAMIGEDASYVRPMDAGENKIGPLVRSVVEVSQNSLPSH